jgi:GlpG protein
MSFQVGTHSHLPSQFEGQSELRRTLCIRFIERTTRHSESAISFALVAAKRYGFKNMRTIGQVKGEAEARLFSDFLYVQGIKNNIEPDRDGRWAVWVHSEDELEKASAMLLEFDARRTDEEYKRVSRKARELREEEEERDAAAAKRQFDGRLIFHRNQNSGFRNLTGILIVISVVCWILSDVISLPSFDAFLMISHPRMDPGSLGARLTWGLPEVRSGQIWRLITPVFRHLGILHIFFNMLWLRQLGGMVEVREGKLRLTSLVLGIGVASNLAEYLYSGPNFGGMSGVVYGLLGYIWMKGTFQPSSGYFLHESVVVMMLIWFVLGLTGQLGIANVVHAVGLAGGVAWGFVSARRA